MELASMPVTPLARHMWRFLPEGLAPRPSPAPAASHAAPVAAALGLAAGAAARVGPNLKKEAMVASTAAAIVGLAGAVARAPQAKSSQEIQKKDASALVARYQSRDETGRVWGVPAAFGKGQCLDCPKKAAPPSMRCEACQLALAQGAEMAEGDAKILRDTFGAALGGVAIARRAEVEACLAWLYEQIENGKISKPIQVQLLSIAKHLSESRPSNAAAGVRELVGNHWRQHRHWLTGLKCLVSSA